MLEIALKSNTENFNYGFETVEKILTHIQDIKTDVNNAIAEEYVFGTQEAHGLFTNYLLLDAKDNQLMSKFSHVICGETLILPIFFKISDIQIEQEIELLFHNYQITKIEQRALVLTAAQLAVSTVHIAEEYELQSGREFNEQLKKACEFFGGHILKTKNCFYVYHKHIGVWEQRSSDEIKKILYNDFFKQRIRFNIFNEFYKFFEISLHVNSFPTTPNHLLILENGAFDPVKRTLVEHCPFFYARHKIGFSYNPNATAPRWDEFLSEIFSYRDADGLINADFDQTDKIAFLKQFFGLCLTPDTSYCKALVLQGDGANGKSVVLSILKLLVGVDNCTNVSFKELKDKFKAIRLKYKRVNMDSDADTDFLKVSEAKLKMFIGGESTIVEEKYKAAELLRPTAKFIAAMNHLPRVKVSSFSNGIERRFEFLHFGRIFENHEQDLSLTKTLAAELAGIFNFALDGLQELHQKGQFTIPQSSIDIKRELIQLNDPVKVFYEERLELLPKGFLKKSGVTATELLRELENFAVDNGYDVMGLKPNQLSTSLKRFNLESYGYQGKKLFPVKLKEITSDEE